jgi:arylamine N-acetyltransferase
MTNGSLPIDEILEALELPRSEPGIGYLQALFARFNERVPFESASKIVRNADVPRLEEKSRTPEIFWSENLSSGAGGTCFARVAAFEALLSELKFVGRFALGRVQSDFDHAALRVTCDGREWIADVGFPLPALLPGAAEESEEIETPRGSLRVTPGARSRRVEIPGGVPEGPRELEIFNAPVSKAEFLEKWRKTWRPDSKFLTAVLLHREKDGRAISFAAGELRVDDRHSRTRIPLAAPRAPALEEQFGVDSELLSRALAIAGDPEPEITSAEVNVYLEVDASAEAAFDTIASVEGYRGLMEGVARVAGEEAIGEGWRLRLLPPVEAGGKDPVEAETAAIEEEVSPERASRALRVRRGGRDSFYQALDRGGRTFLLRRLILEGARQDLLRNDSLRGRFAGMLAVDLLAWARRLGRGPHKV